jgi:hypothetical protein
MAESDNGWRHHAHARRKQHVVAHNDRKAETWGRR